MSAPALEVEGLTVRFGGAVALDRVGLAVAEGELRCLIGPNGAGKSSLFGAVAGWIRPAAGTVRVRGEDVAGRPPHEVARRGVGFKTQVPSLFEGLTVEENLRLAARSLRGPARRAAVEEGLEAAGLGGLRARVPAELAHGERQRVELAMVAAQRPRVALLDEPAAGAAGAEAAAVADLVRALAARATVVVVEHDLEFVRRVADRVSVLHRGRILAEGTMDEVAGDARVRGAYLGRDGG